MRILLVEDTSDLALAVKQHLISEGHTVDLAETLSHAKHFWLVNCDSYDVIVLDIELPDGNGSIFLEAIRSTNKPIGVLILTARSEINDKVHLLDLGADDYLTKPFALAELDARLRSVHRRWLKKPPKTLQLGQVSFDPNQRSVWVNNQQIYLRGKELKLLEALMQAPSYFLEKSALLNKIYALESEVSDNALEVHVSRLRKKMISYGLGIQASRGLGYQLVEITDE